MGQSEYDVRTNVASRTIRELADIPLKQVNGTTMLFLFLTHTTLSVPALMGAIMCMGVATANSILVVSFAKARLEEHGNALRAAVEAGTTRFRPVIMTALAMIIGMVPMVLGLVRAGWIRRHTWLQAVRVEVSC
jgi:multidrug efflux pump subunit AcrB